MYPMDGQWEPGPTSEPWYPLPPDEPPVAVLEPETCRRCGYELDDDGLACPFCGWPDSCDRD
jgi:hypothetical protein